MTSDLDEESIGLLLDNRMKAAIKEVCRAVFKEEFEKAKIEIFRECNGYQIEAMRKAYEDCFGNGGGP